MTQQKKIMVIDDDQDHLLICRFILERKGYRIFSLSGCKEEKELMEAVSMFRPDLVFIDHNMPGICGTDLTKILKSNTASRNIPVIYFTIESDIVQLAREAGADGYLIKPFEIEGLLEIAKRFVA